MDCADGDEGGGAKLGGEVDWSRGGTTSPCGMSEEDGAIGLAGEVESIGAAAERAVIGAVATGGSLVAVLGGAIGSATLFVMVGAFCGAAFRGRDGKAGEMGSASLA